MTLACRVESMYGHIGYRDSKPKLSVGVTHFSKLFHFHTTCEYRYLSLCATSVIKYYSIIFNVLCLHLYTKISGSRHGSTTLALEQCIHESILTSRQVYHRRGNDYSFIELSPRPRYVFPIKNLDEETYLDD